MQELWKELLGLDEGMPKQELGEGNAQLLEAIRRRIGETALGAISFRDYMELCLYHPEFGYYTSGRETFGREGDFFTSPYIGSVLGDVLARFVTETAQEMDASEGVELAEWGGGSGRLAAQVLDGLRREAQAVYARTRFTLAEASPAMRGRQREALSAHAAAETMPPQEWFARMQGRAPGPGRIRIVYANELLDAMPVHRVTSTGGDWHEVHVAWDGQAGRPAERLLPLADPEVSAYLAGRGFTPRREQTVEANLDAIRWTRAAVNALGRGVLVLIDYGGRTAELAAPHRLQGTLACYYRHTQNADPYALAGEQDITSDVDFDAVMDAAREAGAAAELMTQNEFLLRYGVLEMLQAHRDPDPFSPVAKRNRAIRHLLLSSGMGERFKVCVIRRK